MSVELEFVGHASFRLWEEGHPTILMDPLSHDECKLAYDGRKYEAEMVLVSSMTDPAHDNVGLAVGNPRVVNALDVARGDAEAEINGGPLIAVQAAEHPEHTEHSPNDNALYAFQAGGLWFVHMGDLGYELTPEQLAPFKERCDVFMAITGEQNTPTHAEVGRMVDFLEPRFLFPMHYNIPPLSFGMSTLQKFLDFRARDPVFIARNHKVALPLPIESERPTIVVLEPSGYEIE